MADTLKTTKIMTICKQGPRIKQLPREALTKLWITAHCETATG